LGWKLENLEHMRKLTPKELAARRKRAAEMKLHDDYHKRFGDAWGGFLTPDVVRRRKLSLETGVDLFADEKRKQAEAHAESHRKHLEFLARPLPAKTEREYTALIQDRALYEGACQLSWGQYFKTPSSATLSEIDLAYASLWTSHAPISAAGRAGLIAEQEEREASGQSEWTASASTRRYKSLQGSARGRDMKLRREGDGFVMTADDVGARETFKDLDAVDAGFNPFFFTVKAKRAAAHADKPQPLRGVGKAA
jgi:hypothetical protein